MNQILLPVRGSPLKRKVTQCKEELEASVSTMFRTESHSASSSYVPLSQVLNLIKAIQTLKD